jgi:hypothetical protein
MPLDDTNSRHSEKGHRENRSLIAVANAYAYAASDARLRCVATIYETS